jgi:ATP adenylyltransferase
VPESCEICAAQRGQGPLIAPLVWQDEMLFVCHAAASDGQVVLGHLIVETRRHVAYLHGLSDAEAQAVGRAVHRAAVGLRAELDVEFIHSAVVNQRMEHFHQHVFVRHRGTPAEFGWWPASGWPYAPRGNAGEVSALCTRLGSYFAAPAAPQHR